MGSFDTYIFPAEILVDSCPLYILFILTDSTFTLFPSVSVILEPDNDREELPPEYSNPKIMKFVSEDEAAIWIFPPVIIALLLVIEPEKLPVAADKLPLNVPPAADRLPANVPEAA